MDLGCLKWCCLNVFGMKSFGFINSTCIPKLYVTRKLVFPSYSNEVETITQQRGSEAAEILLEIKMRHLERH